MSDSDAFQLLTDPVGAYTCPACGTSVELAGHEAFSLFPCPSCQSQY